MKPSGLNDHGSAAKTALAPAVEVLGAAGERGVRDTEPPLPNPDPGPLPPPVRGDPVLYPGCDEDILSTKRF